jgi:uncharacterized membrane protein YbhN (UPF0104 family)
MFRFAFPALVFWYLSRKLDASAMGESLQQVNVVGALACVLGVAGALASGMLRWRLLMAAYGAHSLPSWTNSARLFSIGAFYNLLPGAVGGDLVRAYAVRDHFEGGATQSLSVVFVERVLGMAALLALTAGSAVLNPGLSGQVLAYALLGLLGAVVIIAAVALARRLSPRMPARLASVLTRVPALERPQPFVRAAIVSVGTHISIALGGHVLIATLSPRVTLIDSLVIFPLGTLAAYFPATVAGAGARDAALVVLFERIGVSRADALTTSIALLAANVLVASVGGVFHLLWREEVPPALGSAS